MQQKTNVKIKPLKIAIIGAGFSGSALAASMARFTSKPLEIILLDKTARFGAGEAYSTPFPYHLLNVRAKDMSAFESEPQHFVNWLKANADTPNYLDMTQPLEEQFAPRRMYGNYLKELLKDIQTDTQKKTTLILEPSEVVDIIAEPEQATLVLQDQRQIKVDKVILALGNNAPSAFPFPIHSTIQRINNPWDYTAPEQIKADEPVLIVGTGLSMIDAVLTLHHQHHQGKIYAVSRHGLLPLPHSDNSVVCVLPKEQLPNKLSALMKHLRLRAKDHMQTGGDWRAIMHAVRNHIPAIWQGISLHDKKRFLRHLVSYWNVHRHRVHDKIFNLLTELSAKQQLNIISGHVIDIENSTASIKLRGTNQITRINIQWLINCMGPTLTMGSDKQTLVNKLLQRHLATLDPLRLGFSISVDGALKDSKGHISSVFYTLGPPAKGEYWECSAVPEIRKQVYELAKKLIE